MTNVKYIHESVVVNHIELDLSFNIEHASLTRYYQIMIESISWFEKYNHSFVLLEDITVGKNKTAKGYAVYVTGNNLFISEFYLEHCFKSIDDFDVAQINEGLSIERDFSPSKQQWPWHIWVDSSDINNIKKHVLRTLGDSKDNIVKNNEMAFRLPVFESVKIISNVNKISSLKDFNLKMYIGHDHDNLSVQNDKISHLDVLKLLRERLQMMKREEIDSFSVPLLLTDNGSCCFMRFRQVGNVISIQNGEESLNATSTITLPCLKNLISEASDSNLISSRILLSKTALASFDAQLQIVIDKLEAWE